jgi:hypothetical protein
MAGRGKGDSAARRKGRAAFVGAAIAGVCLFLVAPVIGDGLNSQPAPAPQVIAATHPATSLQVAGARGLADASASAAKKKRKKAKPRTVVRRVTISSRITDQEILTEEGKGTFIGIKCPTGSKAISGGVLSKYINLLVSSSAPNHPLTKKYTPNIWWLTVVNVNVDGNGGTLPWQGVVNCMAPIRLGSTSS